VHTCDAISVDLYVLEQVYDVNGGSTDTGRKQWLWRLHVMRVKMIHSVSIVTYIRVTSTPQLPRQTLCFASRLAREVRRWWQQVNSAFHPSGIGKSSTGWSYGTACCGL